MSTIVVVKKNGRVVIGADTLTRLDSVRESAKYIVNPSKLVRLGDSVVGTVGHASFGLLLQDYASRAEKPITLDTPLNIFRFALGLHETLKSDYFLNPNGDNDDEFETSQLSALIANPHGIFGLYSLRSVQEYTRFYARGSGNEFALGAMHAVYDLLDDAEDIAHAGLQAAAEFDSGSSAPFNLESFDLL